MEITVKFFAGLREHAENADGTSSPTLPEGAVVSDVFRLYSIDMESPKIILLNGKHAGYNHPLVQGDVLSIFPPVAGG